MYSNESVWHKVKARYEIESDTTEKQNLLRALASTREPWIISKLLELSESTTFIRQQNYPPFMSYLANNPVAGAIVWNYYR